MISLLKVCKKALVIPKRYYIQYLLRLTYQYLILCQLHPKLFSQSLSLLKCENSQRRNTLPSKKPHISYICVYSCELASTIPFLVFRDIAVKYGFNLLVHAGCLVW